MNRQEDVLEMQDQLLKYRSMQISDDTPSLVFLFTYAKLAKDFQAERERQSMARSQTSGRKR
jgi:hypothetical protein